MNNHTHTQYTNIFTWKPNVGENHIIFFLYVFKNYIHWKHQLPLFSSCNWKEAPTPYIFRLQPEGSSNSPILWLQPEGGYNPLCSRLQPEGGYNHLSFPHPTTLKYKCQITDETTVTLSL
jgi:hypothetical protein